MPEQLKSFEVGLAKKVLVNSVAGLVNGDVVTIHVTEKRDDAYVVTILTEEDLKIRLVFGS